MGKLKMAGARAFKAEARYWIVQYRSIEMEIGLEELGVQNGEFSKFSSMPPVEKQELVFTREKKKLKSVYFDSNGS
nr:hypothetical protein CFP56_43140 [Quercus suber]